VYIPPWPKASEGLYYIGKEFMNSVMFKLYGFLAGVSLLAFLASGQFAEAQVGASSTEVVTANIGTSSAVSSSATNTSSQENATSTEVLPTDIGSSSSSTKISGVLNEREQERIINLAANITNRMEATIERLRDITKRLESRANKVTPDPFDVTDVAKSRITYSLEYLDQASESLDGMDELIYNTVTSDNPMTNWPLIKEGYARAKESINLAYNDILGVYGRLHNPTCFYKVQYRDASCPPDIP
jgi:hypothetical protein